MSRIYKALLSLRRDPAIEAGKLTFAILGVGSTLAQLAVMRFLLIPAAALVVATWAVIYRMCE